ncbi:hypothetical protein ILUMI_16966, partial [Ignelater luminosus]
DAVTYCQQVATTLRSAQFNLQKWNSNNPNIIKHLQVEDEPFSTLTLEDKEGNKTLGIVWNSRLDIITYPVPKLLPSQTISKKNIPSDISKIYDPLGLVSPRVVLAKILIQKLWAANLDWDENVSPDLAERWLHFRSPFKIFSKQTDFRKIFASLTDPVDLFVEEKIARVQEFTVLIYGIKYCTSVNKARYCMFQKSYGTKKDKEQFMKKIKGIDSNLIPPYWKSLKQKILRTIYVNSMYLHATDACCVKLRPEDCGWFFDGYLKPTWFVGDPTPLQVDESE